MNDRDVDDDRRVPMRTDSETSSSARRTAQPVAAVRLEAEAELRRVPPYVPLPGPTRPAGLGRKG